MWTKWCSKVKVSWESSLCFCLALENYKSRKTLCLPKWSILPSHCRFFPDTISHGSLFGREKSMWDVENLGDLCWHSPCLSCSLPLLPPDCSGRDSWCPSLVEPQVLQGQAASEDISGCRQLHGFPGGDAGSSALGTQHIWHCGNPAQMALWEEAQTCCLWPGHSSTPGPGWLLRSQGFSACAQVFVSL